MKKRNLLFIPFLLGMGIGFFSCIDGSGRQTYMNVPAVVGFNLEMGGIVVGIPSDYGYLAAPSLTDVSEGDFIYINQFTIDSNNQPSANYITASNISKEIVDQSSVYRLYGLELGEYTLPLSNVKGWEYGVYSAFHNGRFFVTMSCKDKNPTFNLIYNMEEAGTDMEPDGVKNLYLVAKPSSGPESSDYVSARHAFNLSELIQNGPILTDNEGNSMNLRYIKINLKYLSKMTDGKPEFTAANSTPIMLCMFQ